MKPDPTHIALALSIIGLAFLGYAAEVLTPPVTPLPFISTSEVGRSMHIQAEVEDIHEFKGGSLLVTVAEEGSELKVYLPVYVVNQLPNDSSPKTGCLIDVIGELKLYRGDLEIVVEDTRNLEVVSCQ